MHYPLLLGIKTLLKFEPNLLSILVFVLANVVYLLVMRNQYASYVKIKNKKPLYYKLYRVYSRFFLSKVTSRSEREFYVRCNWITISFGIVIILSFLSYIAKVFTH